MYVGHALLHFVVVVGIDYDVLLAAIVVGVTHHSMSVYGHCAVIQLLYWPDTGVVYITTNYNSNEILRDQLYSTPITK